MPAAARKSILIIAIEPSKFNCSIKNISLFHNTQRRRAAKERKRPYSRGNSFFSLALARCTALPTAFSVVRSRLAASP